MPGHRSDDLTQRGRRRVRFDRNLSIAVGCAHDDLHRTQHYGTEAPSGDVSLRWPELTLDLNNFLSSREVVPMTKCEIPPLAEPLRFS